MASGFSVVGKRLPRPDVYEKITGTAQYMADIKFPRLLVGKVLRSPFPHARILKVDTSKAEALQGVEAVVTGKDVVPRKQFAGGFLNTPASPKGVPPAWEDQYVINEKARYVGDAVAAVAAIDEETAEEAVGLIEVEYEELPAVFDPRDAIKPGAPVIHDSVKNNIPFHMPCPISEGDLERGFKEADCIVEGEFSTTKQAPCPIEPSAAIARFDPAGRLTVYSQSQLPHLARSSIADIFDMPVGMIKLINPAIGGHFGVRLDFGPELLCALLAKKAGGPVKLEYTKEEDFVACHTRTGFRYNAKLGFKNDGTLTAIEIKAMAHLGGYMSRGAAVGGVFMSQGIGKYRCPSRLAETDFVYTNTSKSYAMRGFGNPAMAWGVEQLMDEAAEKLGIDPVEIRLKNVKQAGEPGSTGLSIPSIALDECLKIGSEKIGWKKKRQRKENGSKRYGIGMACMMHTSGSQPQGHEHSNAFIKLNEDGSASLIIHPCDPGTGSWGTLAQIAAEELGIGAEDIQVVTGDTDITMFDVGSKASRVIYNTGNAVLGAARDAKAQILERAAEMLGTTPDELDVKDRYVYVKSDPEKRITHAEVARRSIYNFEGKGLNIFGKCSFDPTTVSPPSQAAFAEIEVDVDKGKIKLLNMLVVNDSGTVINPTSLEGQIEGGVAQGIGFAMTEHFDIDQATGTLTTDNFETYKLPTTLDMPEIEIVHIERPDPIGPFGAKSVGESSPITIAPAIANAIYHAIGVRIRELPITPEKILAGLETIRRSEQ